MSGGLATRCPACGTVFRVVADQLRVSEGWVRCGRCSEVFNAAEHLLDLGSAPSAGAPVHQGPDRGTPGQAWTEHAQDAPAERPPERSSEGLPVRTLELPPAPPPRPMPEAIPLDTEATTPLDFQLELPPSREAAPRLPAGAAALPAPHELLAAPDSDDAPPDLRPTRAPDLDTSGPVDFQADADSSMPRRIGRKRTPKPPTDPSASVPSFLRRAERAQQWRRPRVRAALGVALALSVLLLAAQVLYAYRDLAAARFAGLRGPLESACEILSCIVGAAHAIEGLAVESSGLVRVEKSNVYKLSVAVRNHAAIDLAVPALDLTLTDAQGKLLARRVLRAADLGVGSTVVAAGSELAFQGTLQAASEPVAGYTIDLFYP